MLARTNCRQILTNNNNNNNNSNNKQAGTRTIQSTTKGACVPVCQFSSAYFCGILHSQTHHCKLLHLYLSSHLPKFVPASCIRICENANIFVHVTPLCCFLEDRSTRWFVIWIHCADGFCPVAPYTRWVALLPDIHSIIKFDVEQFAKFVNVKKFKSLQ